MRVAIDCMILRPEPSGVERAVSGLIEGLASLAAGDLEISLLLPGGVAPGRGAAPVIQLAHAPAYHQHHVLP